ncbi:MAG: hypothetical protein M3Y88_06870 [Chloroflexota bacterium]|nr:hypothetical protein [Chloroflexota bacterium]
MSAVHGFGASLALIVVVLFIGFESASALLCLPARWRWVERLVLLALGSQVVIGAALYLGGARPREPLHLLYGAALLAVIPLASTFAAEAPPRPRGVVMVGAGIVLLLLAWRLRSTG